jgi:hypothetical protein
MHSAVLRARLESVLGERIPTPFTDVTRRVRETIPAGIDGLNIPRGAITEILGPLYSGRTSLMLSLLAEITTRDEVCALVDGGDTFRPYSGAHCGVDLRRLLWTRCVTLNQVLKSTDLLLQGGGFGLVAVDLTDIPGREIQATPPATWFRFQRSIEKTPTILVVVAGYESVAKSAAALVIRMDQLNPIVVRSRHVCMPL